MNNLFLSVNSVLKNCFKSNSISLWGAVLVCSALSGCGGGGGSKSAASVPLTSFSGTAAVGTAIANANVSVSCIAGTPSPTTTDANGKYSIQLAGLTLPCILSVSVPASLTTNDPVYGAPTTLYSAVYSGQAIANITPITQLILANALGTDPSGAIPINSTIATKLTNNLANATAIVNTVLTRAGITTMPSNPLTTPFIAATNTTSPPTDTSDEAIDLFMNAIRQATLTNTPPTTLTTLTLDIQGVTNSTVGTYVTNNPLASNPTAGVMTLIYGQHLIDANYTYDMESLTSILTGGLITTLTNSNIGYATSTGEYVNLIGNFTFSGSSLNYFTNCTSDPTHCVVTELPDVSGTITEIHQSYVASDNQNQPNPPVIQFMVITKLNLNEATVEGLIEQGAKYKIWELIAESNGGLTVWNNGITISCPLPSSGGSAATLPTLTSAGINVEQSFITNCKP